MGNQITISGSIKDDEKMIMLHFTPCALGAPASEDLSVFEKKEDNAILSFLFDGLSFINGYLTKTSLHKQAYISIFIHYCVCCNTYGTGGYVWVGIIASAKKKKKKINSLWGFCLALLTFYCTF